MAGLSDLSQSDEWALDSLIIPPGNAVKADAATPESAAVRQKPMGKRERLRLDRQYREHRLAWRREVEVVFDLKRRAPDLPEPGVLDLADTDEG